MRVLVEGLELNPCVLSTYCAVDTEDSTDTEVNKTDTVLLSWSCLVEK